MLRLPLGVVLSLLSLALVSVVVGGIAGTGLGLFREIAEESARSRVQLAALAAASELEALADDVLTTTRLLAERPTLSRLVAEGDEQALTEFLARFGETAGLTACAVITPDGLVASGGDQQPWESALEPREAVLFAAERDGVASVVAASPLSAHPGSAALARRHLDGDVLAAIEAHAGLPLRLTTTVDAGVSLADGAWRATQPVSRLPGGDPLGVEVRLDAAQVDATIRSLSVRYLIVASLAGLVAIACGLIAARLVSRPFRLLGAAARRIGLGDLATPVPALDGAEASTLATTMEEMRRRLRELTARLLQREAEAKALLEGVVEGVFAVDGERRIQYMNPPAARGLGVDPDIVVGRFCGDVLKPTSADGRRPCDAACPIVHARSGGGTRAVEHVAGAGAGERRTVVITSAPPIGGRQVQIMRDETGVEAARRARDAVLAHVSHELKTPLSAQLASIELLRDTMPGASADTVGLVDALTRSTLRLTRLIDNLLESVRIETGRTGARFVPVDLAVVVRDSVAVVRPLVEHRCQEVVVDVPAGLTVDGAPAQLAQALVNLLANANKFAPDRSRIHVTATRGVGTVALAIEDTGPGIPEGEVASVFDRFHRADEATAGVGLGLWIVKSIVERHGGRVRADASPRGGARFTVTLPCREEP